MEHYANNAFNLELRAARHNNFSALTYACWKICHFNLEKINNQVHL